MTTISTPITPIVVLERRQVSIDLPQFGASLLGAHSALKRDNLFLKFGQVRGLLKNREVGGLRLKSINLTVWFRGPRQNHGRVADVRADIQHNSATDQTG